MPRGGVGEKKGKMGNRSRTDRAVGRGLLLCAKGRRGKKQRETRNNRSRTDREVCREILPCATRWRQKENKKKSVGHHLCNEFSFCSVPWGGVRMEGDKQTIFKDIVELLGVFSLL